VFVEVPDRGGDFTTTKRFVQSPVIPVNQTVSSGWYVNTNFQTIRSTYQGAIRPSGIGGNGFTFPPSAASSDTQLSRIGTEAIANCAPTNSVANLATALAELYHDGIPKLMGSQLWRNRTRSLKALSADTGDEYLNAEFGWNPLVKDILDVTQGVLEVDRLVNQYYRDSGRIVRRRHVFPPVITEVNQDVFSGVNVALVGGAPLDALASVRNQGTVVRNRVTTIQRWFSGAFTYCIPETLGTQLLGHKATALKLMGVELTPEVLWELTPWSWAVDWFSNLGSLITNLTSLAFDGLVVRYGYVMEHSIVRDTYIHIGPTGLKDPSAFCEPYVFVTETKLRRRATPFGFGLDLSFLTNRQRAIMAALGLSRIR